MSPDSLFFCYGEMVFMNQQSNLLLSLSEFAKHVAVNKLYSSLLLDKLIKLYLPTLPLWTMIMFGKSGVHRCSNVLPKRTTGAQEQRFTMLKEIGLQEGKTPRIYDFTNAFYKPSLAIEKDYIALYLHKSKKNIAGASNIAKKLVSETWNKSHMQYLNLRNPKLSKYNQPSFFELNDLNKLYVPT